MSSTHWLEKLKIVEWKKPADIVPVRQFGIFTELVSDMKVRYVMVLFVLIACDGKVKDTESQTADNQKVDTSLTQQAGEDVHTNGSSPGDGYANGSFKNVTIQRVDAHTFVVEGEARVFEGTVSWVVEDGHNELVKGFETTDAGAPAWGHFAFTIEVQKREPNSTLTLVLFESSAKDGSRLHELPVPLP